MHGEATTGEFAMMGNPSDKDFETPWKSTTGEPLVSRQVVASVFMSNFMSKK